MMNARTTHLIMTLLVAGLMVSGAAIMLSQPAQLVFDTPAQPQTLPPPYLSDANAADAPYGPAPRVDGRIAPGEYAGAYQLTLPTYGGNLEVFIRQDTITLYLALDSQDIAPFGSGLGGPGPAFQIFLDTQHNGGAVPLPDDYRLTLMKNNGVAEDRGDGSSWGGAGTGQWTAQAFIAAYGWQGEFAIGLSKLGITPTGSISIGLAVAEVWTPSWPKDWYWPTGGYYLNPSTWGNLTSSSYWSTFYWKPGPWEDYAPSGVPDFDQKQANWIVNGQATHCGPVAAADSLWWFDSKFETPDHQPPAISDTYSLMASYGAWDDHAISNVVPFVDDLATNYFGTNQGITGTHVISMFYGLNNYLRAHNLWDDYRVTLVVSPTFPWVADEVLRSEDVILLLGFYEPVIGPGGEARWARVGGHYVTIAGLDLAHNRIAFSDPMVDWQEMMPSPFGRVLSGTLLPHLGSHGSLEHNDAGNISHDSYGVLPTNSPGGLWGVYDYPVQLVQPLFGANPHPTIPTEPWGGSLALQIEVEYALAVSPYTWKASGYGDYAPNGVPDIDQKQDSWKNFFIPGGQWSFCGPVAAANSLWWFDSKFESSPIVPPALNDHYPLIDAYGQWDDHDPLNVDDPATPWSWPPVSPFNGELVEDLASRAQTDIAGSGTTITNLVTAIDRLLIDHHLRAGYTITQVPSPDFWWVAEETERSEDVILLLGFYPPGSTNPERVGGHFVTVAGVDKKGGLIAFSDPYWDNAEQAWPLALVGKSTRMGRVASGALLSHSPLPGHPAVAHNDAGSVSHDIYYAAPMGTSGGWGPSGYVQSTTDITDFIGANGGGVPVVSPLETRVEWAIAVSPVADVWLQKAVTPLTITHGARLTFTLSFGNDGSLFARDVTITDVLPAQLISPTVSASRPITPLAGLPYAWHVPDLPWQQGGIITMSGLISAADLQLIVTNTAIIATSSVEQDQLPSLSNRASAAFTIVNSDIDVAPIGVVTLTEGLSTTRSTLVANLGDAPLTWNSVEVLPVTWLSAVPISGVVLSQHATPLTLTFDATGLFSHTYTTTFRFISDDPDESQIDLPLTLIVPPPDIRLNSYPVAITLTTGAAASRWITVANVGQSTLSWSVAEMPSVTWLGETPDSGYVAPGTSAALTLTFNAAGLNGLYTTTLRLASDDPDQPQIDTPLTLTVLAPHSVITPTDLAMTLVRGTSAAQAITIANTGTAPLTWALGEVPSVAWLTETPSSGTVLAHNAAPLAVTFDATGLPGGAYTTTLRFISDDPDRPQIDAPITLTVLTPHIVIAPAELSVVIAREASNSHPITISNTGAAPLAWTLAEAPAVAWLSAVPGSGTVLPHNAAPVAVTFDATGLPGGVYTTTLRFTSDDPDRPQIDVLITLTVFAPNIELTPALFTVTLTANLSTTRMLTVANQGKTSLTWTLIETPTVGWLSEGAYGGVIGPNAMTPIALIFDATGVGSGVYITTLRVTSNDLDQPQIDLPVALLVPYQVYLPLMTKN